MGTPLYHGFYIIPHGFHVTPWLNRYGVYPRLSRVRLLRVRVWCAIFRPAGYPWQTLNISPHYPPLLLHMVQPKLSHHTPFHGFRPPAPSPTSCLQTHSPTTTTSSTPPHHLPPSPETEPHWLGFNIFLDSSYFISFSLVSHWLVLAQFLYLSISPCQNIV